MNAFKLIRHILLICCIGFASQAFAQTTKSLTINGVVGSIQRFNVSISIYKNSTLMENTTVRLGEDEESFIRNYTESDYPTSVSITVSCMPGMEIRFNGLQVFYYYYTICDHNEYFSLTQQDNNTIDIISL